MNLLTVIAVTGLVATPQDLERWFAEGRQREQRVGAIVAEVGDEVQYHAFGTSQQGLDRPPDRETRFEIGSITKAFTNLLLAEMVAKGVVRYDTRIGDMLGDVEFGNPQVADITLLELATHTSGLPRLPGNLLPGNPADPYADYDEEKLIAALAQVRRGQQLTKRYAYSNLGVGLLGYLLGSVDGRGYAAALRRHVLAPLGLEHTTFGCVGVDGAAVGHSGARPVSYWTLGALAGAGALCASAADMVRLIKAYLHGTDRLQHDLRADLEPLHPARNDLKVTRVWHVSTGSAGPIYWHNGGTGGFRTFVGFTPDPGKGLVILTNSDGDVTEFGLSRLGRPRFSEQADTGKDQQSELAEYTGHFALSPSFGLSVTLESGTLYVQATGQPKLTLAPAGDDSFNLLEVDAQLKFKRDETGTVDGVVLHQGGRSMPGERVDSPITARTYEVIDIDPALLDDYVGRYRLAPGVEFTIRRDGDELEAQLTGQPFFTIYPHARDRFHYEVVDAQLDFNRDGTGRVISLTLHQHGLDQTADRIGASD